LGWIIILGKEKPKSVLDTTYLSNIL